MANGPHQTFLVVAITKQLGTVGKEKNVGVTTYGTVQYQIEQNAVVRGAVVKNGVST
jgi:hypothetical protein